MKRFKVPGSGFRVSLRFRVPGSGFGVSARFKVPGSGFRIGLVTALLCVCALPARVLVSSQAAPQQAPVFRSGARLTIVDVTVTDKQGRPVEGLTAGDFAVTEDGEPQAVQLVAFQRVDSDADQVTPAAPPPVPAARIAPAVQPTISASPPGDVRYRNRRLVVLYFDLTAMPPPDQMRAYKAARKFVGEQMRA